MEKLLEVDDIILPEEEKMEIEESYKSFKG